MDLDYRQLPTLLCFYSGIPLPIFLQMPAFLITPGNSFLLYLSVPLQNLLPPLIRPSWRYSRWSGSTLFRQFSEFTQVIRHLWWVLPCISRYKALVSFRVPFLVSQVAHHLCYSNPSYSSLDRITSYLYLMKRSFFRILVLLSRTLGIIFAQLDHSSFQSDTLYFQLLP